MVNVRMVLFQHPQPLLAWPFDHSLIDRPCLWSWTCEGLFCCIDFGLSHFPECVFVWKHVVGSSCDSRTSPENKHHMRQGGQITIFFSAFHRTYAQEKSHSFTYVLWLSVKSEEEEQMTEFYRFAFEAFASEKSCNPVIRTSSIKLMPLHAIKRSTT